MLGRFLSEPPFAFADQKRLQYGVRETGVFLDETRNNDDIYR